MAQEQVDLETIVVDDSWKKQALVVGLADRTPLDLNVTHDQTQRISLKHVLAYLGIAALDNLADRMIGTHPNGAPRRVFKSFPGIIEQVNFQDLKYFAHVIEYPMKFLELKGFQNITVILNRSLEPYMLYAAIREIAGRSDEKTVNFVYILAHSDGRFFSNTSLGKYGIRRDMPIPHTEEVERFLRQAPAQQVYEPAEISQRLRRSKGVHIIYVNSCHAGNLFDGMSLPPRSLYIATSDAEQLDGGYWLNQSFLKEYAWASGHYAKPIDVSGLKIDPINHSPSAIREVDTISQTLSGSGFRPLQSTSTMVIKGNVRLIF